MERSRMARRQDTTKKPKQQTKKPKQQTKKPMWRRILLIIGLLLIVGVVVGGAYTAYAIATAPPLDEEKLVDTYPIQLLSAEGEPLEESGQIREYVSIDDISEVMQQAVISIEDRRFYEHNGIDVRRIGGAVLANVTDGFGSEGGSTITQQLVKQSFLSTDKKLKRKLQEQWLAVKLEREYTKEQILEMYLNKNYYGSGAWGVQAASKTYFNKPVSEVNYQEAAILAGLPQRPSAYDPIAGDQELTRYRQEQVLSAMKRDGHITEQQYNEALDVEIADVISPGAQTEEESYTRSIYARVQAELEEDYGLEQSDIYGTGLKVYTSINKELHAKFNKDIKTDNVNIPNGEFPKDLRMGATVLNTKTGEIVAVVDSQQAEQGDKNYRDYSREKRQIGSTAKPFFDYGPGIEKAQWSTGKILMDAPFDEGEFNPKNYYTGYRGANTMRYYLTISGNTPAVRAFQEVQDEFGPEAIESFVENVGIEPARSGDELLLSNTLGTAEASTTQMAAAYAALGANGMYTKPHLIQKIEFNDGSTINSPIKAKQAMEDYTAYMLTDMLRDVVNTPTGTYAPDPFQYDVAGKTGTTNDKDKNPNDKWFTGYTTDYSISVWTGKAPGADKDALAEDHAQYYFDYMMQEVTKATGSPDRFQQPDSVLSLGNELYVKGTKPKDLEPKNLPAPTGASINYDIPSDSGTLTWSYNRQAVEADGYQGLSFTVTEKRPDGSERVVGTTEDTSIAISGLRNGTTTFTIVATASNQLVGEQQSSPAQTQYTVERSQEPAEEEEEPATEETPPEEEPAEETPPNETDNNNGNGNNGNGNGNNEGGEGETTEEPATEETPPEEESSTELESQSNSDTSESNQDRENDNRE
ncbi:MULTISPECIES: transglycosylase domain-containing protein [unclassified Exiguobacterium]|uniref:transglycosylase domain-containing protein n=1 Tax=unclassified Exiguobacterium TaxID=2644629 RepID=UPI001038EC1B|nr:MULTISPECIES: transglycosylase domain-containing protein [unclassified Exiguobacterium]TCI45380.1 penicillin-binding protein [Exiguobacterium sp. SH5S32]TCI52582.1 penicillin-binding protein [Exiguobacterium sp. SH1S4]TCI70770.1 penicillin-binding protein [Exiguobacterium sp. SH1S1]